MHGGEIEFGAMTDAGSVLDLWITCPACNPLYPSLVGPPRDQVGNLFSAVDWTCPRHSGNCAHYRLKLHQNKSFESVMALTYEIGDAITYSVVMTGTLGH
jgi:hypothetical protein